MSCSQVQFQLDFSQLCRANRNKIIQYKIVKLTFPKLKRDLRERDSSVSILSSAVNVNKGFGSF